RRLQTKFNDKLLELEQLRSDVDAAKDAMLNSTALTSLAKRITSLETTVNASTAAFAEASSIMDLIEATNDRIDQILLGNTSLELKYNTSLFKEGYGIKLGKTVPNELTIASDIQSYSTISEVDFSVNTNNEKIIPIGIGGTQIRHLKTNSSGNPIPYHLTQNLTVFLDDSVNSWKTGQALR